ncbi:cadherin-like protein 26 [Pagrus major]|uniref:cadherin-like protein 26 n=1 Tax=Pagrus major TaxID=143350 RepID=UPI003CC87406
MLWFFLLCYYLSSAACSELLSRHRRAWIIDSMTLEEGHKGPFPYELGKINIERDYLIYFDLFGEGVDEEPTGVLSIDKTSGIVYVHKAVDYEEKQLLKLKFEARRKDSSIDTKLGVEITIKDINDNPPRFQQDLYEISISEETAQGSHLMMVSARDRDMSGTPNSMFDYEIKSFFPKLPDTEFFVDKSGVISFKGCLDHQVAETFTVLVEAKDHGEVVRLSSSTTVVIHVQDGNNHLPNINGQTGSSKVKEHESGISPLRLHVTDKDTPNSTAWRAKYSIQGDEGEHFKIETDPVTNDGILTVVKPLDFEEGARRELSISVENEKPYFSCKVKKRTSLDLWEVETSTSDDPGAGHSQSVKVLIEVEDTNDPPEFSVTIKDVTLEENAPSGTWVEKVTAVDHDSSPARKILYGVAGDPEGWVKVDPLTGNITTVKGPDRESPHVVNGVYTILLLAVDDDNPPMTGTATLSIHVKDLNDNVPQPTSDYVDVCLSDGPTTTNITAFDRDEEPYGGPFLFELLGDVRGKWKLNPSRGYTAGLVNEPGVYAGSHILVLKISDTQGVSVVHNISVTACTCSVTLNCTSRRITRTQTGSGAIIILLTSLLLLLLLLLLLVKVTWKKKFTALDTHYFPAGTLLQSNTEGPGKDWEGLNSASMVSTIKTQPDLCDWHNVHDGMQQGQALTVTIKQNVGDYREENVNLFRKDWNQTNRNSLITNGYYDTHQTMDMSSMNFKRNSSYASEAALRALLHRRLYSLLETEDNLSDFLPRCYADEGDLDKVTELESISIPDNDSFERALEDLDHKFNQLASICKPPNLQN